MVPKSSLHYNTPADSFFKVPYRDMFVLFSYLQSRDVRCFAAGKNIFETSSHAVGRLRLADIIREGILGLNRYYSEVTSFDLAEVNSYSQVQ